MLKLHDITYELTPETLQKTFNSYSADDRSLSGLFTRVGDLVIITPHVPCDDEVSSDISSRTCDDIAQAAIESPYPELGLLAEKKLKEKPVQDAGTFLFTKQPMQLFFTNDGSRPLPNPNERYRTKERVEEIFNNVGKITIHGV